MKKRREEKGIYRALAEYLTLKNLEYRFDIAADIKLTPSQAAQQKRIYLHKRGFPDLVIFEKRGKYGALFLEIKKNRAQVFNKDGTYKKDKHIQEQREYLKKLEKKGYKALFVFGLIGAIKAIEEYLNEI